MVALLRLDSVWAHPWMGSASMLQFSSFASVASPGSAAEVPPPLPGSLQYLCNASVRVCMLSVCRSGQRSGEHARVSLQAHE